MPVFFGVDATYQLCCVIVTRSVRERREACDDEVDWTPDLLLLGDELRLGGNGQHRAARR